MKTQYHQQIADKAFDDRRYQEAEKSYSLAISELSHTDDEKALELYESLGLTRYNLQKSRAGIRALLRALNGDPSSRQRSLRYLIPCLFVDGKRVWARRSLLIYEEHFGPHPDGWTLEALGFQSV